jgi:hypothetical protein
MPFPIGPKEPLCQPNEKLINGKCMPFPIGPKEPLCQPNEKLINGKCTPFAIGPKPVKCKPGEKLIDGDCVKLQIGPIEPECGPNEKLVNGKCRPDFRQPKDKIELPDNGPKLEKLPKVEKQAPERVECPEGQAFIGGRCRPEFKPQDEVKRDKGPKLPQNQLQNEQDGNNGGDEKPRFKREKPDEQCHEGEVLIRGKCRPAPQ